MLPARSLHSDQLPCLGTPECLPWLLLLPLPKQHPSDVFLHGPTEWSVWISQIGSSRRPDLRQVDALHCSVVLSYSFPSAFFAHEVTFCSITSRLLRHGHDGASCSLRLKIMHSHLLCCSWDLESADGFIHSYTTSSIIWHVLLDAILKTWPPYLEDSELDDMARWHKLYHAIPCFHISRELLKHR